ncbi:MAG: FIST C-terminal domain-containing protein [Myxococcales bacterium]|nr:FIST C-terminal domain-containing protein [Myxococcales bacterium]
MTTRAGTGSSRSRDSVEAGREAAATAARALEGARADFALVFATVGHDQGAILSGVREVVGGAAIAGCSAEGVITRAGSDESSHAVVALVVASDELTFHTYAVPGFVDDSRASATALAREIAASGARGRLLLLFPDGLGGNCTDLVRVLEAELPFPVTIAGGTAGDLFTFEKTFQYHGDAVRTGSLTAVLVDGKFAPEVVVTHGCDLVGVPLTVTETDGGYVRSIDGRPAWGLFKGYLDASTDSLEGMHLAHLLLAEHLPTAQTASMDDFTVRVPVGLDAASGALFFAAGIARGTQVQIALRNEEKVCERATRAVADLAARRPGQRPLFVLQLDCAGRGRLLLGDDVSARLIEPAQGALPSDVPWIGLHTYGEIAPVQGRTYFHNYTAVFCALYPSSD